MEPQLGFTGNHMVLTSKGYLPIAQVTEGMFVMTSIGRLRKVIKTNSYFGNVGLLKLENRPLIECTEEQTFIATQRIYVKNKKQFQSPFLSRATDLKKFDWCALLNVYEQEIPWLDCKLFKDDNSFFFFCCGIYCGYQNLERNKIDPEDLAIKCLASVLMKNKKFRNFCMEQFGPTEETKRIPTWIYSLPHEWKYLFFNGYRFIDKSMNEVGDFTTKVKSRALAFGIADLLLLLGNEPFVDEYGDDETIYRVEGLGWVPPAEAFGFFVGETKFFNPHHKDKPQQLYSLEVEGDESYIVDGVIVGTKKAKNGESNGKK